MNLSVTRSAVALWGLLAAMASHAQFGSTPADLSVVPVATDLYVISNVAVPGLVTVLVTDEGVLLVDDKFEIDHDNIMAALRTITDKPVKYVINTHYHGDHAGGNAKLQALGAIAVASANARAQIVLNHLGGEQNITTEGQLNLYFGGKRVEIHPVGPAHTNGDVVVLFPDYDVLTSGDIFANGPGTSAQLVDYPGGGSAKAWPLAIDQALALEFDTVIPGHGLVSRRADLQAYRDRAQRFSDTLASLVAQKKSRAEIEAVVRAQFDWEDFHVQAALDGLIGEFD